ncbi:unnamed protein product [Cylicocyclus nassatus]|uniref:Uncharacterized protein n=1 Tax=Cylicocyclus nassatus TaxID=53992 RepID=A0AA36GMH1_CYLNA|nr:unnamed protein product [Cylicocyclus nassatus]
MVFVLFFTRALLFYSAATLYFVLLFALRIAEFTEQAVVNNLQKQLGDTKCLQKATAAKDDATPVAAAATEKMEVEEALDEEILHMASENLKSRTHLLYNEIRIMRSEVQRINHSVSTLKERIK